MIQKSYKNNKATLYLIPTPIGNLEDITIRSLNILKKLTVLLCEDTRTSKELLDSYDIKIDKLIACHDHNEEKMGEVVTSYLDKGIDVGLVTDRGTPIISDPGYKVVAYLANRGYNIVSLPGATAFVPALTASGIAPEPFTFYGFLNSKKSTRVKELNKLKNVDNTIIFYEAPHRILDTLNDIKDIFGNRNISISREISKMYETIYRGTISEVIDDIKDSIKGEMVIVVEGNNNNKDYSEITIKEHVDLYIKDGMKSNDAIKLVAKERSLPKSDVYMEYIKERDE